MYVLNAPQWRWNLACIVLVIFGLVEPLAGNTFIAFLSLHWAILFANAGNIKVIEKVVLLSSIAAIFAFATVSSSALIMVALYGFAMGVTAAEERPLVVT